MKEKIIAKIPETGIVHIPTIAQDDIKATADFYFVLKKTEQLDNLDRKRIDVALDRLAFTDKYGNKRYGLFNEHVDIQSTIMVKPETILLCAYLSHISKTEYAKKIYLYGFLYNWTYNNIAPNKRIAGQRMERWQRYCLDCAYKRWWSYTPRLFHFINRLCFITKMKREMRYDRSYFDIHSFNIIMLDMCKIEWLKKKYYRRMDKIYGDMHMLFSKKYDIGSAIALLGKDRRFE
jgi:hypothetical protein